MWQLHLSGKSVGAARQPEMASPRWPQPDAYCLLLVSRPQSTSMPKSATDVQAHPSARSISPRPQKPRPQLGHPPLAHPPGPPAAGRPPRPAAARCSSPAPSPAGPAPPAAPPPTAGSGPACSCRRGAHVERLCQASTAQQRSYSTKTHHTCPLPLPCSHAAKTH